MKSIKATVGHRITLPPFAHHLAKVMAVVIAFTICAAIPALLRADDGPSDPSGRSTPETVVIEQKSRNHCVDAAYRQYRVSPRTLVTGPDGKQINYIDMPVPCEAQVRYRTENGERHLLLVRIRQIRPGASKLFPTDVAE